MFKKTAVTVLSCTPVATDFNQLLWLTEEVKSTVAMVIWPQLNPLYDIEHLVMNFELPFISTKHVDTTVFKMLKCLIIKFCEVLQKIKGQHEKHIFPQKQTQQNKVSP